MIWRVLAVVALLALPGGAMLLALRWAREKRRTEILERMSETWRQRRG